MIEGGAVKHGIVMGSLPHPPASRVQIHYDELYVPEGEGPVSREVSNLFLNHVCNTRILPRSELDLPGAAQSRSSGTPPPTRVPAQQGR